MTAKILVKSVDSALSDKIEILCGLRWPLLEILQRNHSALDKVVSHAEKEYLSVVEGV